MKKFSITLLSLFLTAAIASAQVIKGDMNDDGVMDIGDVNESVNTVLGKRAIQYVQGGGDMNGLVAGTWYDAKTRKFVLNADGTTDYPGATTYNYIPTCCCILFVDEQGKLSDVLNVISLQDGVMVVNPWGTDDYLRLATQPIQLVTSIAITPSSIQMLPREAKVLNATVLPADADNKKVTWSVDNPEVIRLIEEDVVYAVTEGIATITCSATDGSGVMATCKVIVGPHEYVDLGLPGGVLWATCNVGADKPEDYGLYFAWGDTTGYAKGESHSFNWANYKWYNGSYGRMTKYCTTLSYGKVDNKTVLDPEDDAATANWGADWRMPTLKEITDLYDSKYTTTERVTVNGVNGRKITSKSNGNSIFLPAAGYRVVSSLYDEGSYGYYWSSSLYTSNSYGACYLEFSSSNVGWDCSDRYYGRSVRAVRVASE